MYHLPSWHPPSLTEHSLSDQDIKHQERGIDRVERWMDIGRKEMVCLKYLNRRGIKSRQGRRGSHQSHVDVSPPCVPSHCVHALAGTLGNLTVIDSIFL